MKPFSTLLTLVFCYSLLLGQSPRFLPGLDWDDPQFSKGELSRIGIRTVNIDLFEGKGYRTRLKQSTHCVFDSAGLLTQQIESVPGDTLQIEQFSYNDRGVLNSSLTHDLQWNRTYRTGYRFNGQQQFYQVRSYEVLQNQQRLLLDTRQYLYDDNNLLTAIRILENGQIIEIHRYEYDQYGRPIAEIFEDPTGKVFNRVSYTYDEDDRITRVLSVGTIQTEYVYEFDPRGLPKRIMWKENKEVKSIVTYAYNPDGTVSKMERVDSPASSRPSYLTKVMVYDTF